MAHGQQLRVTDVTRHRHHRLRITSGRSHLILATARSKNMTEQPRCRQIASTVTQVDVHLDLLTARSTSTHHTAMGLWQLSLSLKVRLSGRFHPKQDWCVAGGAATVTLDAYLLLDR
jgi:hypothetical protein